jgi:(S)-ureidoglycine aminohydrolase
MPLDGYVPSLLPQWKNAEAKILAAPALGANFAEYLISALNGASGEYTSDNRTETFIYMLAPEICDRVKARL